MPLSLTALLQRMLKGDKQAENEAYSLVYEELRRIARKQMLREYKSPIRPSALINETYERQLHDCAAPIRNRSDFFGIAAIAMRRVLVELARERDAQRRGQGVIPLPIEHANGVSALASTPEEMISLDAHLSRLERLDPPAAKVFDLRYFSGHTCEEVAELLGRKPGDVRKDWDYAKGWLRDCILQDRSHAAKRSAK